MNKPLKDKTGRVLGPAQFENDLQPRPKPVLSKAAQTANDASLARMQAARDAAAKTK